MEPDPVPDRSLVTRLGKIGRRASRPLRGGARYARCRPVVGDQKQGGCYNKLETVLSVSWKPSNGMDIVEENCYSSQVKEEKNLF